MSFEIALTKSVGGCRVDVAINTNANLVALVGPSGIGKTTLLNCIAGLTEPDQGTITIAGVTLFDSAANINVPPCERGCGYVFQDARLFPHLNIRRNLLFGKARGQNNLVIELDDLVTLLDIAHLLDRMPANLSGGEVRRVALGRALMSGPQFLLLDEPLASLDPDRAEQVLQIVEKLQETNRIPTILVSHDQTHVDRLTSCVVKLD